MSQHVSIIILNRVASIEPAVLTALHALDHLLTIHRLDLKTKYLVRI